MKKEYLLITGLVILLIITTRYACNSSRKAKQEDSAIRDAENHATFSKDSSVAKTSIIVTDRQTAISILKLQKDSTSTLLLKTLEDNKHLKSAVAALTTTNIHSTQPTKLIHDTITKDTLYTSDFKNDWYAYKIIASRKNISLDLQTFGKYTFTTSLERKNIFSKQVLTATFHVLSPLEKITNIKAFESPVKQQHWGFGVNAGIGINKSFQVQPTINVGVQYTIISF